ncbi:MAG TPA: hypothetical protein VMR45_03780 [Patescibacteria group bacterium]|jgi:hypothetical protein|nr:hypothetical protein [Patescibacteria group bacterium]
MNSIITNILTNANLRSGTSVEQALIRKAEVAAAWLNSKQEG